MKTDRIVMRPSEHLEDWYLIVHAVHDGKEWLEQTGPNSSALRCSERISDADVEGTLEEMHEIARAIQSRGTAFFKRCAVQYVPSDVSYFGSRSPRNSNGSFFGFWSPRNSQEIAEVSVEHADEFAAEVFNYIHNLNRSV